MTGAVDFVAPVVGVGASIGVAVLLVAVVVLCGALVVGRFVDLVAEPPDFRRDDPEPDVPDAPGIVPDVFSDGDAAPVAGTSPASSVTCLIANATSDA